MKLLVLTTGMDGTAGGWGRYSSGLVSALRTHGVESSVVTSCENGGTHALLPGWGEYHANFFLAPFIAWRLRFLVKECDAIHAFVEPYAAIAWWLSRFSGKPYFVTAHGTYAVMPFHLSLHLQLVHRFVLQSARAIIAVSDYTKGRLAQHGIHNVETIENGIDLAAFWNDMPLPFSSRDDLILSVGALKRRKGQHVSLEAFVLITEKFPHLRYCMMGTGTDDAYLERLRTIVRTNGIEDRVEFLTEADQAGLLDRYRKAKVHILTPLSEGPHFEGFGLVYLEAGAAGIPSIGTRGTGAENAITHEETGLLVPQNDAVATAEALSRLLDNEQEWTRMSAAARENALAHDWAVVAGSYARLYGRS